MSRTVRIILGFAGVVVLMGAAGGVGFALGHQAGAASARAQLEQFIAERSGGTVGGSMLPRQGDVNGGGQFVRGTPAPGQMQMRGGLTGVIDKVTDDSVQVTLRNQTFTVRLNSQTQIYKNTNGTLADLEPGGTILITGENAADGSLTARSIQIVATPAP